MIVVRALIAALCFAASALVVIILVRAHPQFNLPSLLWLAFVIAVLLALLYAGLAALGRRPFR